jgi:hypothetical protein
MKIFTETLKKVKDGKNDAINKQNFELAASLRDVEREMCKYSFYDSIDLVSFMRYIKNNTWRYEDVYKYLQPLERKIKLDKINNTLKPLIRMDKIRKIEKLNKKL